MAHGAIARGRSPRGSDNKSRDGKSSAVVGMAWRRMGHAAPYSSRMSAIKWGEIAIENDDAVRSIAVISSEVRAMNGASAWAEVMR